MVTDKHTHATTITYAASMPISYKLFGKYNNIEEKNQSEYIKWIFQRFKYNCFDSDVLLHVHVFSQFDTKCKWHFVFDSFI